jgi:hypothetical protein
MNLQDFIFWKFLCGMLQKCDINSMPFLQQHRRVMTAYYEPDYCSV